MSFVYDLLQWSGRKPDGAAYGFISFFAETMLFLQCVLSESKWADTLEVDSARGGQMPRRSMRIPRRKFLKIGPRS